jgi:endonuclease/exonuclease/phosphatase family metal-dependent hydrolase
LLVLTANAASGRGNGSGPDLGPDIRAWAEAVAGLGADVVAVQEVDHLLERSARADQTAQVGEALAAGGPPWEVRFAAAVHGSPGTRTSSRPADRTRLELPSYGVALASRYPVRRWWELRMAPSRLSLPVPLPPGGPSRVLWAPDEQRVALAALVASPAGDVTVLCTHLSFAPVRAALQLRELAAWSAPLPRPLVVLGDLNLPGRLPARVTGWEQALPGPTYPAGSPRVQLDHVLLDAGRAPWSLTDAATHPAGGSDHLAVLARLRR